MLQQLELPLPGIPQRPARLPEEPPSVPVETSEAAARAIGPRVAGLRGVVLEYIRRQGIYGATDQEIAIGLAGVVSGENTVRPRRGELQKDGHIRKRGTRKTRAGRQATVWVATCLGEGDS